MAGSDMVIPGFDKTHDQKWAKWVNRKIKATIEQLGLKAGSESVQEQIDAIEGGGVKQTFLSSSVVEVSYNHGTATTRYSWSFPSDYEAGTAYSTWLRLHNVTTFGTIYTVEISTAGAYGFNPQTKVSADDKTSYAQVRYVTGSRDEPVVWILRKKADGDLVGAVFDPECGGRNHPFVQYRESLPDDLEILCLQLKDSDDLRKHLYKNGYPYFRGFLEQVQLGIYTGIIKLEEGGKPRLGGQSAPAIHQPDVRIMAFKFDREAALKNLPKSKEA